MNNIKKERESMGVSVCELADAIGTTVENVINYENGSDIPSTHLMKMCMFFECSADYLLGIKDKFLTVNEAADVLRCHPVTLRRRCEAGRVRAVKFCGRWLVDIDGTVEKLKEVN